MPTASTIAPLTKIATVKHQYPGLKIHPNCSWVRCNAPLMASAMSPRTANTIAVVANDTQLTRNSFGSSILRPLSVALQLWVGQIRLRPLRLAFCAPVHNFTIPHSYKKRAHALLG
jgi:hypothetical protein